MPIISHNKLLAVHAYTPTEGESTVPISATVDLHHPDDNPSKNHSNTLLNLRLVLGRTALTTAIRELDPPDGLMSASRSAGSGRWQLSAFAPPFENVRFPRHNCIPLTVQALVDQRVIDSVTFGAFTYWESTTGQKKSNKRPRDDDLANFRRPAPDRSSPPKQSSIPFPTTQNESNFVRTTLATQEGSLSKESQTAELEWVITAATPHPDSLSKDWSDADRAYGRRLIRFHRAVEGRTVRVSCQPIHQESFDPSDTVISCILQPGTAGTDNFWFTSVDVISLLERLIGHTFTVEEKNRIRRNLEGLKPKTVSKNRFGWESFFQRIMDFPVPKPRNIEKDVKVFPWSSLTSALSNIIARYSVCILDPELPRMPPVMPPVASAGSGTSSASSQDAFSTLDAHAAQPQIPFLDIPPAIKSELPPSIPMSHLHDTPFLAPDLVFPEPAYDDRSRDWRESQLPCSTPSPNGFGSLDSAMLPYNPAGAYGEYGSVSEPHVILGELSLAEMEGSFGHITPLSSTSSLPLDAQKSGQSPLDGMMYPLQDGPYSSEGVYSQEYPDAAGYNTGGEDDPYTHYTKLDLEYPVGSQGSFDDTI